jgi:hypothetical protein
MRNVNTLQLFAFLWNVEHYMGNTFERAVLHHSEGLIKQNIYIILIIPCGSGVEYLHRSPVSHRR